MKPPKFHAGQAVACTFQNWHIIAEGIHGCDGPRPRIGCICHIGAESEAYNGDWYYELVEFPDTGFYLEKCFTPVEEASNEAIAELLEEVFTPVHA